MKTKKQKRGRGRPFKSFPRMPDGRRFTPQARLAHLIREARLSMGRKAWAVAAEVGLSESRYYEIESADFVNPPPLPALLKIAALLQIPDDAIIPRYTECSRNVPN